MASLSKRNGHLFPDIDGRNRRHEKLTICDAAERDGHRPQHPALWYLSSYEFVSEWELALRSYPQHLDQAASDRYYAELEDVARTSFQKHRKDAAT